MMKEIVIYYIMTAIAASSFAQAKVDWITTSQTEQLKVIHIKVGNEMVSPSLKADSFNTLIIKQH